MDHHEQSHLARDHFATGLIVLLLLWSLGAAAFGYAIGLTKGLEHARTCPQVRP